MRDARAQWGISMIRKLAIAVVVLLSCARLAHAQTTITMGPISVNDNVEYNIVDVTSAANAQSTEVRIRVDTTGPTGAYTVVAAPTCTVSGSLPAGQFRCTAKIPQAVVTAVNVRGAHTIRLYTFAGGVESPPDTPFTITTGPAAPQGSRFTR